MTMANARAPFPESWRRPPVPTDFHPDRSDLAFQWVDIDMYSGSPLASACGSMGTVKCGGSHGPQPIVRMYGVTEEGNSVMAHIHGFSPYFLCQVGVFVDVT